MGTWADSEDKQNYRDSYFYPRAGKADRRMRWWEGKQKEEEREREQRAERDRERARERGREQTDKRSREMRSETQTTHTGSETEAEADKATKRVGLVREETACWAFSLTDLSPPLHQDTSACFLLPAWSSRAAPCILQ